MQDLAKKKKIKTLGVSMGQGQEIIARKYMATATVEGQWVLLQNTHLGLGYLTEVPIIGLTGAYYGILLVQIFAEAQTAMSPNRYMH